MGDKIASLTKKEWDAFFKKVLPIIKGFQDYVTRLESGDKEARKNQDEYNKMMNKKYNITSRKKRR